MEAAPDDYVIQFLCIHKPATFAFFMSASEARRRSNALSAKIAGAGQDPPVFREETENALSHNIRRGMHMDPERQIDAALTVVWLTMTGHAAVAAPNAEGLVIEFSESPLSSRNPNSIHINFGSDGGPPSYVHYWTDTSAAVTTLNEALQAQARDRRA